MGRDTFSLEALELITYSISQDLIISVLKDVVQNCLRFEFVQYTSEIHHTEVIKRFVFVFVKLAENFGELMSTLYSTLLYVRKVSNLFQLLQKRVR